MRSADTSVWPVRLGIVSVLVFPGTHCLNTQSGHACCMSRVADGRCRHCAISSGFFMGQFRTPPAIRILRPGGKDYTRCLDRGLFPAEVFEVILLEAGFGFFMRACSDMSLALDLFNCTTIFLKSLT